MTIMAKRARTSDMRHKVEVYRQVNVRNKKTGITEQRWLKDFTLWCRKKTIFREQLETVISGAEMLRDRIEFECRYTENLTTRNRVLHNGKFYRVSIVGDTLGTTDRIRFLAESLEDGGA